MNGVFERRPENFAHLMRQKERFSTFFPLGAAVSRNIVSIAAHEEVPPHWQQFPMFKAAGNRDPKTGRVTDWWLWDGESQERIRALAPEQQQLPILAVWNDTLLVERISNGWTPADEV
ncbi:MAG: hypothetical protein ABI718_12890 [Acidobacteriota bacterium]